MFLLSKLSERRKKQIRLLVQVGIIFSLIGIIGMFSFVEYTTKPKFCRSCHNMIPYVDSWSKSEHNHVPCVDCHYEPGLLETFEGKFKALSQVAKYVTQTEGTKPWAEVSDNSCMRDGCHSRRLLKGDVQFGKIKFNHLPHLLEMRRGITLRCTSCHSQIVQGQHLTVTKSTCFLCHFKPSSDYSINKSGCYTCHGPPKQPIKLQGFTFEHKQYLDRNINCNTCHNDIIRGVGEVPKSRCNYCHSAVKHLEKYDDTDFLHLNHVTNHKVECNYCHIEITHSLTPRDKLESEQQDCSKCHVDLHNSEINMFDGTGAKNIENIPSAMFLARVGCSSCHISLFTPSSEKDEFPSEHTIKASGVSCVKCHGAGFSKILTSWQTEIHNAIGPITKAFEEIKNNPTVLNDLTNKEKINSLMYNLNFITNDHSKGAHNFIYAITILKNSLQEINNIRKIANLPEIQIELITPIKSNPSCTNMCHVRPERIKARVNGVVFNHAPHLLELGMECSDCHSTDKNNHGKTEIPLSDCQDCHHPDAESSAQCSNCHVEVTSIKQLKTSAGDEDFMAGIECLDCHDGIQDNGHQISSIQSKCADCHEESYKQKLNDIISEYNKNIATLEKKLLYAIAYLKADNNKSSIQPLSTANKLLKELTLFKKIKPIHNLTVYYELEDEITKFITDIKCEH